MPVKFSEKIGVFLGRGGNLTLLNTSLAQELQNVTPIQQHIDGRDTEGI